MRKGTDGLLKFVSLPGILRYCLLEMRQKSVKRVSISVVGRRQELALQEQFTPRET